VTVVGLSLDPLDVAGRAKFYVVLFVIRRTLGRHEDAQGVLLPPVPFVRGSLSAVIVSQLSVVLRSQVLGRPGQEFIGFMSVLAL
jgi:hypothetical protein